MAEFIRDNAITIFLALSTAAAAIIRTYVKNVTTRTLEEARSMDSNIYKKLDEHVTGQGLLEDRVLTLEVTRREDKERQDRFEIQIMQILSEVKSDIKKLLGIGEK